MIKQVQTGYSPSELEQRIREYWSEKDIYAKVKESRLAFPDFFFVDGPPYTTGSIHLGTSFNKTLKDAILRFKRMQRHNVRDQPGYDMHGLPIEVKVEQSIGVRSKKEIEKYGIDRFVSTCRTFALDFQRRMTEQFKQLGVWMDWEKPYMTVDPEYIQAAWWTLRRAYDKGLLISSERVLSWCPRCETALAEAEIEYSDQRDPSIFVKLPLKEVEASLLIWTTTPWTLPANMAVAVNPDFDYAVVRYFSNDGRSDTVIVLEEQLRAIGSMAGWDEYEVLERMPGSELVGLEYMPPLADEVPYQKEVEGEWVHRVLPSKTLVSAENTGLVHMAPGHGPEDFELGEEYGLKPFCPVDGEGHFTEEAGKYKGDFVKKANDRIIEDLENKGLLFHQTVVEHRYGHCWRCDSPVIYRTTWQWFLKVTEMKRLMLDEVERVRWTPDWAGSARQHDWVMNARDWCISRQRYWGIPLPIWKCNCGEIRVVSSLNELKGAKGYREDIELHRPWIDELVLTCDKCGGPMKRVPDVLDVWFDAGVCSWAQLGFPGKTEDFERWWPAKWITEAHDQTRGWFYSQLAAGCTAFERAPYESVLMHGWVLDPEGQPMSKSRGNVIEPERVVEEYGADSLRFYMLSANAPWEDLSFQMDGVRNAQRTLNILWNVFKFASTYLAIDKFDPKSVTYQRLVGALRPEDRWLISRTEKMKNEVTRYLNSFEVHKACRTLEYFILEDLSRWYVRLIRDRMWREEGDLDKLAAYKVVYDATMAVVKMLAPICPHITEEIYQHMDGDKLSVHMLDWPTPDLTKVDERLETSMEMIKEIVEIVTRERQKVGLKLRWPLKRVIVKAAGKETNRLLQPLEEVLRSQANVKKVEYVEPGQDWEEMILSVIPNPHAIGKVYRQWSSKIAVLLKSRDARQIKKSIEKGQYSLGIEGQMIKIEPNMVSFSKELPPDVISVDFSDGQVYIDFEITPEIEAEGYARDLIRRIQQMRKDMCLDVEEFIQVEVKASTILTEYFKEWKEYIMNETRARRLEFTDLPQGEHIATWKVDGERLEIAVSSLHIKESMSELMKIPGISQSSALALVEAGYTSLQDLIGVGESTLSSVPGVAKSDVKKIIQYMGAVETVPCPRCGERVAKESERCNACGAPLREESPDTEFIRYLREIGLSEEEAASIHAAGYDSIERLRETSEEELIRAGIDEDLTGRLVSLLSMEETGEKVGKLERSFTYLIEEEKSNRSYSLFENALKQGIPGFCVTRNYPLKIRSKYDLGDTKIIWLSNIGKEDSLRPKDLEKLSFSLEQFISEQRGIVLLDGLEYLITNNSFLTVLRFIQSLRDQVAISEGILLLALNPSTLEPSELNLLEKEVDGIL